jgi:hypothetical protein
MTTRLTTAFLAFAIAAGCDATTDTGPDAGFSSDESAATVTTGMSVVGNQLLKDGVHFMPRGFNMIGALTPAWCNQGTGATARSHFNATELNKAVNVWHANTIRLQVSQRGLEDPTLTQAEITAYVTELQTDVQLARSKNLVVILSMQDQSIGCGAVHPLPSSQTVAAWKKLAPVFESSPYVMYELFNEPQNGDSSADWAQWRNGGATPLGNLGDAPVGFQTLASNIRNLGVKNVLIADGALHAEHLDNITPYLLTDKDGGHGIAYAIHPYYYSPGESYWEKSWGFLAPSRAIIATEWNYKPSDCGTTAETLAPSFLSYINSKGIGITAHAFDYIDTLIADWNWTPTKCGTAAGGAGAVLQSWYAHLAAPADEQ